jgi:hypothetical protein
MRATAWKNGSTLNPVYGIRVGIANREQHFPKPDNDTHEITIVVVIDDRPHTFALTRGFWNKCPEFRDRGSPVLRQWLERQHLIDWPKGQPPEIQLVPLGGLRFRLLPCESRDAE